jgi:hypothetical protein
MPLFIRFLTASQPCADRPVRVIPSFCTCVLKGGTLRTDEELLRDVIAELYWKPSLRVVEIGVSV